MNIFRNLLWTLQKQHFVLPNKDLPRPILWPWPDSVPFPHHEAFAVQIWSHQQLFFGRRTGKSYLTEMAKQHLKDNPHVRSVIVFDSANKDDTVDWIGATRSLLPNTPDQTIRDIKRAEQILWNMSNQQLNESKE